ncbi:MAG TPA: hypothetical protein VHL57_09840, partial [Flavobacteriales bacterium]|nr:hypothetical protein [Flavobacteriales bacterium]
MKRSLALLISITSWCALLAQHDTVYISAAETFTYCYDDNADRLHTVICTGASTFATASICSGQMQACCDQLLVFDGRDVFAPVLFTGNNNGDLTGLLIWATGSAMTVEVTSDAAISCASEGYVPLSIAFGCGVSADCTVGIDEAVDPDLGLLSDGSGVLRLGLPQGIDPTTQITVFDISGRPVYSRTFATQALDQAPLDLRGMAPGGYVLR